MVEVKTHGAKPTAQQHDTVHVVGQFVRNRRLTPTKDNNYRQIEPVINEAYSPLNSRSISVRAFGFHLLQFEKTCPTDSKWIKWDRVHISAEDLERILMFDVDPDIQNGIVKMDNRSHHAQSEMVLFGGNAKI